MNNGVMTLVIFLLAGITDILDGYIARKKNLVTEFGTIFDPIVDKIFQITIAICVSLKGFRAMWIVVIVLIIKDTILIVVGAFVYKKYKRISKSNWFGKTASFIFYILILIIIIFPNWALKAGLIIESAIITSGILALISYAIYNL